MNPDHKTSLLESEFGVKNPTTLDDRKKGIGLSFISLLLLSMLPVIANSRPSTLSALHYAFFLSVWELLFSLPWFVMELLSPNRGIFSSSTTLSPSVRKKTLGIMLLTGGIFSVSTYFYIVGFEKAGTISGAIALQTYPLFSLLWETLFLKKRTRWNELVFMFLIMAGIYYIGTEGTFQIRDFSPWFFIALITPFLWSIAHVTIKQTLHNSPITPNQVTFIRVLVSSCVLGIIFVIQDGFSVLGTEFINWGFQKFALFMGLVYYLELVNWFYAVKYVPVSIASTITTPTPVFTLLLAILFLHEIPYGYQLIGMVVVFLALYGLIWAGNRNHIPRPPRISP